jgi:glycosyltransferase involved in cell wall biosynthesis
VLRRGNITYFIHSLYDRQARKKLDNCDIFVGWSSFSLHTLCEAKARGVVTIIERGSSHIAYQYQILQEEYERFGIEYYLEPRILEKELQEYVEADFISIPSLFVKRTFLERGIPKDKLIHIPYGVDLHSFRQVSKEDNVFRVIFAGAMTLQKGVHYLLQAFAELNLPNAELWLLGSLTPEIKPFFERYAGHYRYLGHIPQVELYQYYSQGSVFVIFSIQEGLAMVQTEAMACGLPVICTTNTGGEDIIRNGIDGYILPIRDVEGLKEKLIYLYENPNICCEMGQSAKKRVGSGFTWDDYGTRIIEKYQMLISNHRMS